VRENQVDGKTVLELSDEDFTEELGLKRLQVFCFFRLYSRTFSI
jgi:hypothetical protein